MVHDLSVIFWEKTKKKETLALLCPKFLAVAVWGKVALIHVAVKVCLFSGLRSICLYNLIEGKFIWDPGISRRVLWKASVVHVELQILKGCNISVWVVISKDYTPVSISNALKAVTSIMTHWKNWPGNCNAEETLSNVILSLIEAILYSDWNFRKWVTWWEFFIKLHKAHCDYTA